MAISQCIKVAGRLERRYPGVRCKVERSEFEPGHYAGANGHALWTVSFFANDAQTLIRHGLATAEQFEIRKTLSNSKVSCHPSSHDGLGGDVRVVVWPDDGKEVFEVSTIVMDYQNDEEVFTKKVQADAARCLKPFIRGTWK